MEKKIEVIINVIGPGTPEKAQELIAKIVEKIKNLEASLGNLQAAVTVVVK
jgi:ABC-type Fe3+-hydroxamate transport system substrate-binding protein